MFTFIDRPLCTNEPEVEPGRYGQITQANTRNLKTLTMMEWEKIWLKLKTARTLREADCNLCGPHGWKTHCHRSSAWMELKVGCRGPLGAVSFGPGGKALKPPHTLAQFFGCCLFRQIRIFSLASQSCVVTCASDCRLKQNHSDRVKGVLIWLHQRACSSKFPLPMMASVIRFLEHLQNP